MSAPRSDTAFLEKLKIKLHRGELSDPRLVAEALTDVDVVVHTAAKVGDWGPVEDYRAVNVEQLRVLLDACKGQALSRFIHVSSLGVYEGRHHYGTDESVPPPRQHADGYTQTKVESEQLALKYHQDFGVPVVVLRPGFVYGPRDRTVLPRIIENLTQPPGPLPRRRQRGDEHHLRRQFRPGGLSGPGKTKRRSARSTTSPTASSSRNGGSSRAFATLWV